ncbi:MAG: enoyl-CoA hydratase-related protein [Actinomycetota bacterium]|nr:enoyl-CoA hydratase-related protein [Actinomycetota bacterium]
MTPEAAPAGVLYEARGPVATVTFNRHDQRNRLTPEAMALTRAHLETATGDKAVRVIVLTGAGSTFCSGADLAAAVTADGGPGAGGANFTGSGPAELVLLLEALLDCPKPTIARIQGHVAAGGTGIVAACDIAIASADAKFAFSEVRLGLAPAVISVVCLSVMHRRDAQELLLTGDRVDAARVLRAGLITSVVASESKTPGALDAEVERYAAMFTKCGPLALAHTKELLRRVPTMSRDGAFDWTSELSAGIFASAEGIEGMTAYLNKRQPGWDQTTS